jgi:hypothetical protein
VIWLRQQLRTLRALTRFAFGWLVYVRTGQTPPSAYQALIQLFCATGGRFNDLISAFISRHSPSKFEGVADGVLGCLDQRAIDAKTKELDAKGFLVFPSALSVDQCARLMKFAMGTPSCVRRMDGESVGRAAVRVRFDPSNPLGVRYDYDPQDLLDCADVQALLSDRTLLAIAQAYLKTIPKADILSMWWHTNFHSQPDSEAAQFFHFDMDRIKWVKIFIYLTDVGPEDGAHSFISESHRVSGIPPKFLRRGYVRLSDEEVREHYGENQEIRFTAPKGTIIIEDTRGLHKGNPVQPGGVSRLMLQLQFSNSLFGAETPVAKIRKMLDPGLQALVDEMPMIYEQYIGNDHSAKAPIS